MDDEAAADIQLISSYDDDQFGSLMTRDQISSAHDEMMRCINASTGVSRPEYDDVVPGLYMYSTVYRAESLDALQDYISEKRAALLAEAGNSFLN